MIKYEIKPSIKLIFNTIKDSLIYGDTPLIAVILIDDFKYTNQEVLKNTNWDKSTLSKYLPKGRQLLKNPIKKLHYELYLKMINDKFQLYTGSINREMLHLSAK